MFTKVPTRIMGAHTSSTLHSAMKKALLIAMFPAAQAMAQQQQAQAIQQGSDPRTAVMNAEVQAKIARQNAETMANIQRQNTKAMADLSRRNAKTTADIQRANATAESNLSRQG